MVGKLRICAMRWWKEEQIFFHPVKRQIFVDVLGQTLYMTWDRVGPSKNLQRYFWDSFRTFKAQLWAKREEFYPWELLQYPPHDPSIHLGPAGLGLVLCKKVAKLGKSLTHDFLADMVSLHTNVNENRILTVSWHWVTPYLTRPKRDQYMMYREFSFMVIRFLL